MYEQPYNPFSRNLSIVKDYFKTKSVLVLGITRVITIILTVVSAFFSAGASNSLIVGLSDYLRLNLDSEEFDEALRSLNQSGGSSTISIIISTIPVILIGLLTAAAFFIIYSKSRSESPASSPKAGITILYVLAVIQLVVMIIATVITGLGIAGVIILLVTGAAQSSGNSSFYFDDPTTGQRQYIDADPALISIAAIVIMVFAVIAVVFALIYSVSMKRYYGSIKASISSVELQNRGAKPYGVFCVIFAVFAGLSLLSIPSSFLAINQLHLNGAGIASLIVTSLASIVSFVQLIFEAKVALGYKKYIDNVKYGYNGYSAGPYAPYNAPQGQAPYAAPVYPEQQDVNPYEPIRPETPANPYADSYTAAPQAPAAFVCPSCGSPVEPDTAYCGNCGTKLK
jgi:hypothetical protein